MKYKILFATPCNSETGGTGGIIRWAQHILNYYNNNNIEDCDIDVLPMSRPSFININNPFTRVYYGIRDYLHFLSEEKKKLKEKRYDIFHLVSSASISLLKDIIMLQIAKKRGLKTIIHFHFGRIPELSVKKNWEWKMICRVVKISDTAIVLDKASYETLRKAGHTNVALLPNPVAPKVSEIIENNKERKRKARTLLFAGHGLRTKGVYELVEACKQIPDIKLRMIGNISEDVKSELIALANNAAWLDVAGEYSYENTIKEMLSCDIFVLPTYTEGFPNVILESMACGCAIVTTPVGAISEMLEEENGKHYGIMVTPKKIKSLKDGIEAMLNNETLKNECRINTQKRVNERYNIDAVWRQMLAIWVATARYK